MRGLRTVVVAVTAAGLVAVAPPASSQAQVWVDLGGAHTGITVPHPEDRLTVGELTLGLGVRVWGPHAAEVRLGTFSGKQRIVDDTPLIEAPAVRDVEAVPLSASWLIAPRIGGSRLRPFAGAGVVRLHITQGVESDTPREEHRHVVFAFQASLGAGLRLFDAGAVFVRGDYRALPDEPIDGHEGDLRIERLAVTWGVRVGFPGGPQ